MHIGPHDNRNFPIVDVDHELVPLNYFNIVRLKKGEAFEYAVPGYETCVVPATGTVTVDVEGAIYEHLGNRGVDVWDPGYENLNFYFDPNTDGEPNENTEVFGTSIDGYQLAFNQPVGVSEISPSVQTAGIYSEAHVNTLFGNNGVPWSGFAGLQMRQTTSVEEAFGYTELFIPWSDFDATDPADGWNPDVDDVGLYHPEAPEEGEEWYFNATRVQTNGRLPAWESPAGAFLMAERPHGILQFAPRPNSNPCDLTGDSLCDAADIDAITVAVLNGSSDLKYDVDGNGVVEDADRVHYVEVELNTWIGDSNLDGEFGTRDLVNVFIAGGYEDEFEDNSGWATGDWNGDLDFSTRDIVAAFISGGYEAGRREPQAAVKAVPEPSAMGTRVLGAMGLWAGCRRRGWCRV